MPAHFVSLPPIRHMNETLLAIIFFGVIIIVRFFIFRVPQPARLYINIISGILLMVLIWFFAEDSKTALKVLMTVLVLSSLYRGYLDYRKSNEVIKTSNTLQD